MVRYQLANLIRGDRLCQEPRGYCLTEHAVPRGALDVPSGLVTKAFYKTPIDFIFPAPYPFSGKTEFSP
jgi:hypothetical protein